MRQNWAVSVNSELERGGLKERIDHRSLKDQGIKREAEKHMGPEAAAMERRGEESRIGNENRDVQTINKNWDREITELEWQESVIEAAIEAEKQRMAHAKTIQKKPQKTRGQHWDRDKYAQRQQEKDELAGIEAAKREKARSKVQGKTEQIPPPLTQARLPILTGLRRLNSAKVYAVIN